MCGLVAVVVPGQELSRSIVVAMRDRLAHRGPDGAGVWIGDTSAGKVGLGHRRLAIIDLSAAGSQPMFSHDRSLCITFNGEIYNYIELRRELESLRQTFVSRSDTEVLLAAYAEWGEECLSRLNGMFAFAIWDARRHHLFVARDRFGEKPLFYAALPQGGIAFASEMKALFAHPELTASADEANVAKFAAGAYLDDTETTMFAGIRRLPPAHAMIVDPLGVPVKQWRYWVPDYDAIEPSYNEQASIRRFRELLEDSIRLRLRADVPVGSSLSGGLDSSVIVGLLGHMRHSSGGFVQNTFSARFDDDPSGQASTILRPIPTPCA
jgi:asparagine synthase (glutamine-hydrolysing)